MSTRLFARRSSKRSGTESSSSPRKMVLNVDLNAYPDGAPGLMNSCAPPGMVGLAVSQTVQGPANEPIDVEATIDVEAIDDEVTLLSSSRGFPQSRNQSRRNRPVTLVLDEELVVHSGSSGGAIDEPITRLALNTYSRCVKIPPKRTIINCEAYEFLESDHSAKRNKVVNNPEPPKVAPEEPTFTCSVCWGPLVEETSTTCGHIFCQKCIHAAIRAQKKCPTCRKTITLKNIHRVYLPTTN